MLGLSHQDRPVRFSTRTREGGANSSGRRNISILISKLEVLNGMIERLGKRTNGASADAVTGPAWIPSAGSDAGIFGNKGLYEAARTGHTRIVERLIGVVSQSACSHALAPAIEGDKSTPVREPVSSRLLAICFDKIQCFQGSLHGINR